MKGKPKTALWVVKIKVSLKGEKNKIKATTTLCGLMTNPNPSVCIIYKVSLLFYHYFISPLIIMPTNH